MDPITIAALAGLAGSALSAGTSKSASDKNLRAVRETNQANLDIMRETNQANAAINQQSLDAQMAMQKDAQRFNSPTTQSQLLRAAGLNPALNDSMAASVSAGSVPASIPAQGATLQPPLVNYSDTYIDSGMRAAAQFVESFRASQEGLGTMIDNQTKNEQNLKELNKRLAEIDEIMSRSDVNRAQRESLLQEADNIKTTVDIMKAAKEDIIKSHNLQNQLTENNAALANQKIVESQEAVASSQLNRLLNVNADARAEREIQAVCAKMFAEAQEALSRKDLNVNELEEKVATWSARYTNQLLNNDYLRQTIGINDKTFPDTQRIMRMQLYQMFMDAINPFKQLGSAGSGLGSAVVKTLK